MEIRPPQRLAPYSFAVSARVGAGRPDGAISDGAITDTAIPDAAIPEAAIPEAASGRLILLHDPAGQDSWDGTLRLVTFVTAELAADMIGDPLLAAVGWSWLVEALQTNRARYTAAGGTVTQTSSTRFGDLAGPAQIADVELRASWTALDDDLAPHLLAWCELLASTAGLPPPGVTALGPRRPVGSVPAGRGRILPRER